MRGPLGVTRASWKGTQAVATHVCTFYGMKAGELTQMFPDSRRLSLMSFPLYDGTDATHIGWKQTVLPSLNLHLSLG